MHPPNESDKRILAVIVALTEEQKGRPPTLSEVALAAGMQSSSRANIQRQLTRLKPTYVNWTHTPRSLHVTSEGMLLLGNLSSAAFIDETPVSDVVLPLLASGLTRMSEEVTNGRPLQAPYPKAWQRGMNLLAAECLTRGVDPPAQTAAFIALCHRPLTAWPARFSSTAKLLNDPLLEDGQPTDFCRELALGLENGDAEWEICERLMATVRQEAEIQRTQDAYVAFRKFLIEHPVLTHEELLAASFSPDLISFGADLNDLYERVPHDAIEQGEALLCGHCGWTLTRRHGRLRCGDDRCLLLTANFTRGTRTLPLLPGITLLRVRKAIRRYVVAPGTYEVATYKRVKALDIAVDLWPSYDRYDLKISFPGGETWVTDFKDWRYPHLLARHLKPFIQDDVHPWSKAYYVIPDDRARETPNYITFLRSVTAQQGFQVVTVSDLIEMVQKWKQVSDEV